MNPSQTDRWMHPAIWWLLFFAVPPVWLFLIVLRYIGIFSIILAIIFFAMLIQPEPSSHNRNSHYHEVNR